MELEADLAPNDAKLNVLEIFHEGLGGCQHAVQDKDGKKKSVLV